MALIHSSLPIVSDSLVLYFDAANTKSYPGSGTTWTDISGGHSATITGPSHQSVFNGGFEYDGTSSNDRITFPNTALPNGLGAAFSIEVWHYLDNSTAPNSTWTYGSLFTNGGGSGDWSSGAGNNNGLIIGFDRIVRRNGSGSEINTAYSSVPSVKTWHQYVFTLDSGTGNMYVDKSNVLSNDTNFRSNYTQVTGDSGIGISDIYGGNYRGEFDGYISIVRIYSKVLSTAEMEQNYDAHKRRYGL